MTLTNQRLMAVYLAPYTPCTNCRLTS